jgi:CheY-like chemotaxis protein
VLLPALDGLEVCRRLRAALVLPWAVIWLSLTFPARGRLSPEHPAGSTVY